MKNISFLFVLINFILTNLTAQDIVITFLCKDKTNTIDSIKVIKVASGETALIKGSNTIYLNSIFTGTKILPSNLEEPIVFPNPFVNQTKLKFYSNQNDNIEVLLINAKGQIVAKRSQKILRGLHILNISVQSEGPHFINVEGEQIKFSQKIISTKNRANANEIEYLGYSSSIKVEKSAVYENDDLIYFFIYSGENITKIADLATKSKTYEVEFYKCKDADENIYPIIQIGVQWWMAENLKTTHYSDGTKIPLIDNTNSWFRLMMNDEGMCYYDDSFAYSDIYGALYTGASAIKACPEGWHLSSDNEWKQMEIYLGMSQKEADANNLRGSYEGSKLAGNSKLWGQGDLERDINFGITGFSILPGGFRDGEGNFCSTSAHASFWTAIGDDASEYRYFYFGTAGIYRRWNFSDNGRSIRCVKDN